jgi:hypothetical protein
MNCFYIWHINNVHHGYASTGVAESSLGGEMAASDCSWFVPTKENIERELTQ